MIHVDPPQSGQARFGLLEAASVVDSTDPHAAFGVEFTPNCGTAHLTRSACFEADHPSLTDESGDIYEPNASKTITDGIPYIEGVPFAVYHLFECRPVGGDDLIARARASFTLSESRAVEEWFSNFIVQHPDAVDLTPATGAVVPIDGLGLLEQWAGQNYGGTPVIHADRDVATLLAATGVIARSGTRLETTLGSRVSAGGGYNLLDPGQGDTPVGSAWMYVTGAVGFWRSSITVADAFGTSLGGSTVIGSAAELVAAGAAVATDTLTAAYIGPPGGGFVAANKADNSQRVLVERQYVGATECVVGAVRVLRSNCCGEELAPV